MTFSYKMNVCQALCMVISYISGGIYFKGSRQNLEKEKILRAKKHRKRDLENQLNLSLLHDLYSCTNYSHFLGSRSTFNIVLWAV